MSPDAVAAVMDVALRIGNYDPDLVAVEARRTEARPTSAPPPVPPPPGATATAAITRPAPSLARYDQLLVLSGGEATA